MDKASALGERHGVRADNGLVKLVVAFIGTDSLRADIGHGLNRKGTGSALRHGQRHGVRAGQRHGVRADKGKGTGSEPTDGQCSGRNGAAEQGQI